MVQLISQLHHRLSFFLLFFLLFFASSSFSQQQDFYGELLILQADNLNFGNFSLHFVLKTDETVHLHLFPLTEQTKTELLALGTGKRIQVSGKHLSQELYHLEESHKEGFISKVFEGEEYFNLTFVSSLKVSSFNINIDIYIYIYI